MGLPNDLTLITVTGTFTTIIGTPLSGQVNFSLTTPVEDSTGKVIFNAFTQSAVLNGAGSMSIVLPCTDNADLNPPNFSYLVTEAIQGLGRAYYVQLPHTLGSTVDLSQLAPVATPPATSAFATANTWTAPQTFSGNPPIKIPTGAVSGYVWTSDGSGDGSWEPAAGGGISPPAGDIGGTTSAPTVVSTHLASALPIAQGGTGQESQQAAMDALAGAQTSGDYLRGNGSHVVMAAIEAADLPTGTTSTQGALQLDGTAGDLQPLGVAAAGSKGQAADSEHVHPYQPWQFLPESYGAKGNGKVITDATIASGSLSTLTSASAAFTSADTGKHIIVSQAGGSAIAPLAATITYVNATTVTLSTAASSGGVTDVGAIYGTDDTTAIQTAINDAVTYAEGQDAYAEVVFSAKYYCVAGAAVTGGSTLGNSQITLPIVAGSSAKVNLALRGPGPVAAAPEHWLSTSLNAPGAVLVCMRTDGTYNATYGPAAVIGGPVGGYGGGGGTFSNVQVIVDGLTILLPYDSSYGGLMLYGMGQMKIGAFSVMPMAVVVSGAAWPQLDSNGPQASQYTAGLVTPAVGNNDVNEIGSYSCYGTYIALSGADHLAVTAMRTIFCTIGWLPTSVGGAKCHGAVIASWSSEETDNPIYAYTTATWAGYNLTGNAPVTILALGIETYGGYVFTGDSGARAHVQGTCWFEDLNVPGYYYDAALQTGFNLKLLDMSQQHGPVASPQAPPASASPWLNGYYQDAWITLQSPGTITALSIDSTAQYVPALALTYGFLLPSGHSYTPAYGGTVASHTVSLL